jgi:carbamoyltransferase
MKIIKDFKPYHIAGLIGKCIPVCVFQGRSEAGPRALGNRSIIFDPTLLNGRKYINKIKGREYWRPFAGTILHEYAHEWFEMKTLSESPFMSYAVKVKENRKKYIPAILHNDGTCRIQTLKREQNPHYYDIIEGYYQSFKDAEVKIPIIGNTSFNVAGDPIVETFDDAVKTLEKSQLEFLYLPETSELIHVPN